MISCNKAIANGYKFKSGDVIMGSSEGVKFYTLKEEISEFLWSVTKNSNVTVKLNDSGFLLSPSE